MSSWMPSYENNIWMTLLLKWNCGRLRLSAPSQAADRSLILITLTILNLFMECLHLININVSHFWMFILLCFSYFQLLLFLGVAKWIKCLDNEKPQSKRAAQSLAHYVVYLIGSDVVWCRNPIKRVGYKALFLRNQTKSSSIPSDAQISRSCPSQKPFVCTKQEKEGKTYCWFFFIILYLLRLCPVYRQNVESKHTIELNKVKVENIKKTTTMIIRSSDWFWGQNLVVSDVEWTNVLWKYKQNVHVRRRRT